MIKKSLKGAVAALLLLILGGGVSLFLYQYEPLYREVYTESGYELPSDSLRALTHFLREEGVEVREMPLMGFDAKRMPLDESIVLLPSDRGNREDDGALLDWVERGGHLIMSAELLAQSGETPQPHPMLSVLGVELLSPKMPDAWQEDLAESASSLMALIEQMTSEEVTRLIYEEQLFLINVPETTALALSDEKSLLFEGSNRYGKQWLQRQYGRGRVSIFKSYAPFKDEKLLDLDHLSLMLHLLGIQTPHHGELGLPLRSKRPLRVTQLQNDTTLPFWITLLKSAPHLFIALLLTLSLVIWAACFRLGPIEKGERLIKKSRSVEHIEANAHWIWRQRIENALIERLRKRLWKRISLRDRKLLSGEAAECIRQIAERTGLSAELIEQALYLERVRFFHRKKYLIETMSAIQKVSDRL
jgi:hypothetical protein